MSMQLDLIPRHTRVESNGSGESASVTSSTTRTFLCTLEIFDQIEQESIDVSIWASAEGENWGIHPLLKIPQRFYRGETRMILDLTLRPDAQFIQARWELNRWGRVAPEPMFVIGLHLAEVPAMPRQVPSGAAAFKS